MKAKNNILLIAALLIYTASSAQIIMPDFEKASIVDEFKDNAEASSIYTFNNGDNIYFYKVFFKGDGEKLRIVRQNIWKSEKDNGKWSNIDRLFTEEDYPGENMVIGCKEDGSKIYIFQNQLIENDSLSRKIGYRELKEDGSWSEFQEIIIPDFPIKDNFYHFYMNPVEDILMISMAPKGNPNAEDIFVTIKENGEWQKLINLGTTINTNRVEISPFIDEDGKTLYFSSEGHGGNGGTDIFVSYRLDDSWTKWTTPINLGDSINTKDYDENFIHTGEGEYYFTSNLNSDVANIYFSSSIGLLSMSMNEAVLMQNQQPLDGITIHVMDKEGELIDNETTNSEGVINHIRLDPKATYSYVIIDDSPELEGSKFYLLDKEGKCISRLIADKQNKLTSDLSNSNSQIVEGKIEDGGNLEVKILDDNGYTILSITTDQEGNFTFNRSLSDNSLKLKYQGDNKISKLTLNGAQINESDLLKVYRNNTIYFNEVKEESTLADYKKQSNSSSSNFSSTIYFDFNQLMTNYQETKKINKIAEDIKSKSPSKVQVIGHTDRNGSEEKNVEIAKQRAEFVASILNKDGIKTEVIIIQSKGESEIANKMIDAKNRRVEVKY